MNVATKVNGGTKKRISQRKLKQILFFASIVTLPILQFCICYIYVNINSFVLAFQKYSHANQEGMIYIIEFAWLSNFKEAISELTSRSMLDAYRNSLLLFFFTTIIGLTLALIFSYYIYKKYPMGEFFRVILFMPKILSGVVFCVLFKYITSEVYPMIMLEVFGVEVQGLLYSLKTSLGTMLFFSLWIGFGINVLMFSGSMSGIDEAIVESAQLDGVNAIQEFIFITVPMIWPTFVSFLTINFTGLFTDQMHLHAMFGTDAASNGVTTFGYYLYKSTVAADFVTVDKPSYSVLAAMGLMMTAVMLPLTLTLRKGLRKFGPSVD